MGFVRFANIKLFCKSANQNKISGSQLLQNARIIKQTGFGNIEENMDLSRIHLAVLINFTNFPLGNCSVTIHKS